MKVPTYDSQEGLNPTPMDPRVAAQVGNSVADLGKGLTGIGEMVQKIDDKRQTYQAQAYLAKSHRANLELATNDPDLDGLTQRIGENTNNSINEAANLIQSPSARNTFIEQAQYQQEVRNVPIYNTILARKSQATKNAFLNVTDEDIKTYADLTDPTQKRVLKQQILDRAQEAIDDGHVHSETTKFHIENMLAKADIDKAENLIATNAESASHDLQKGEEGPFPDMAPATRQKLFDKAQGLIARQGAENNMIFSIAQNHTDNLLIDQLAHNELTEASINNALMFGINGIPASPAFAKAAKAAINDPFPTTPSAEKYLKVFDLVTDKKVDPIQAKLDVLNARGLTPKEKAHLITTALRSSPGEGKQSLDQLIQTGVKANKDKILELNNQIQNEVSQKRDFLGGIGQMFAQHFRLDDTAYDTKLADMQMKFMERLNNNKNNDSMLNIANDLLNEDRVRQKPNLVSKCAKDGSICVDSSGNKARVFPDGRIEEI